MSGEQVDQLGYIQTSVAGGCGQSGSSRGGERWLGSGSVPRDLYIGFVNVGRK